MGRPKGSDSEATRQRLLSAAEIEFGTVGYGRARLEDIAATAGIRRSSLLYYFGSKEQLYGEVVAAVTTALVEQLDRAMNGPGHGIDRIDAVVESLMSFASERQGGVSMFVRELLDRPPGSTEHIRGFVAIIDTLEQFIRAEAGHIIALSAPVRAAVIHLLTSQALRIASGDLSEILWGDDVDPRMFIRALFTEEIMS